MKKIIQIIMFIVLASCTKQSTTYPQTSDMTVLTSLKATELLTQALTEGTEIKIELIVPETYSINSHARYFKKHSQELNTVATKATACITIRSVWDNDDLYPYSRRSNVRIVEIDSSVPIDRTQAGVKLLKSPTTNKISPYIWRSPANLTKMADFIAQDLCTLYADLAPQINTNLKELKKDIFKLRTEYEARLIDFDAVETISLTSDFNYLISEFGIDVLDSFLKQEIDWDQNDYAALARSISDNNAKIVICKRMPQKQLYEVIVTNSAQPVVLTTLINAKDTQQTPKKRLLNLYSINLDAICNGLKN